MNKMPWNDILRIHDTKRGSDDCMPGCRLCHIAKIELELSRARIALLGHSDDCCIQSAFLGTASLDEGCDCGFQEATNPGTGLGREIQEVFSRLERSAAQPEDESSEGGSCEEGEGETRSALMQFRLSFDEHDRLKRAADIVGLSMSEFARRSCADAMRQERKEEKP